MLFLNFTHPLAQAQLDQLANILKVAVPPEVINIPAQFDPAQGYVEQAQALVDTIPLDGMEWQTTSLLVNLPGHSAIAGCVLAQIHGRIGHFPSIIRIKSVENAMVPKYELTEIINLQIMRDAARLRRAK